MATKKKAKRTKNISIPSGKWIAAKVKKIGNKLKIAILK